MKPLPKDSVWEASQCSSDYKDSERSSNEEIISLASWGLKQTTKQQILSPSPSSSGYFKLNIFIVCIQRIGIPTLNKHVLIIYYIPITILALETYHPLKQIKTSAFKELILVDVHKSQEIMSLRGCSNKNC